MSFPEIMFTIETDDGTASYTHAEAVELWRDLAPGEAFRIHDVRLTPPSPINVATPSRIAQVGRQVADEVLSRGTIATAGEGKGVPSDRELYQWIVRRAVQLLRGEVI